MSQPWTTEPDTHSFTYRNRQCYMQRNRSDAWCGYASVPKASPLFGKGYDFRIKLDTSAHAVQMDSVGVMNLFLEALSPKDGCVSLAAVVRCHGGLSFANKPYWLDDDGPEPQWAFGFDCAHAGDQTPKGSVYPTYTYRTFDFVIASIHSMVDDLIWIEQTAAFPRVIWERANFVEAE